MIHPQAQSGGFQPELWMYDVAEFFIAAAEGAPYSEIQKHGMDPTSCRLTATAILDTPEQIFLTTAPDLSGEPDFHQPHTWEPATID